MSTPELEWGEVLHASGVNGDGTERPTKCRDNLMELVRRRPAPNNRWRKETLEAKLQLDELGGLRRMLQEHHNAFALDEDERRETDLVQFSIDIGDAHPLRQLPRRIPRSPGVI